MDWEGKPSADKTWVHCQAYFLNKWTKGVQYRKSQLNQFANNIKEEPPITDNNSVDHLADNLEQVAIPATADKKHIQQMSTTVDEQIPVIKNYKPNLKK